MLFMEEELEMIAAMSTTAISTMTLSTSKYLTKFKHLISFRIPPSVSVCTAGSSRNFWSLKHNYGRKLPTPVAFSGDGTGNGNGSSGIISSGGNGSGNGGDGNEKESLMVFVLPEGGRSSGSFPEMFMQVEMSPFWRSLLQIKKLLVADNLFLTKVVMEGGVAMFTQTDAVYENCKEEFSKKLEIVYANVGMASNADFMLAYFLGLDKVEKNGKRMVENELKDIQRLSPSVGYSLYTVISGNLRYQLLAGVVKRQLRKRLSHNHKQMLSAACYIQVLVESQSDCFIPIKISFHLTGVVHLRNWCMSLMRSQGRYIKEFKLV